MICIFDKDCTDFSANGIGPLCPTSCEVSETLNGEYELKMEHPLDDAGKWTRIEIGRILRVPVPSALTPQVNLITQSATEIYKTNGSSRPIRSSTSTKGKVLAKYKKNKQVALIEKTSSTWYQVIGPDGKQGYMQKSHLTYVRTDYSLAEATGEVVEASQQRDQPFRIYRVVPELDKITVYARHIFYDLLDNMVKECTPATTQSGASVVAALSEACLSDHDFTFFSDITSAIDPEALDDDETVEFRNMNPVEALIGDSGIVHYYEAQLSADNAQSTADAAREDFRRVVRIDDDGLHVGDNQSNGEVLIDSSSVNVVFNGLRYSKFAASYVQFGNYQLRRSADGGLVFKLA